MGCGQNTQTQKIQDKLLKAKYRNNDCEKRFDRLYKKNFRTFRRQNTEIVKLQDKFQAEKNSRSFPGFPGRVDTLFNTVRKTSDLTKAFFRVSRNPNFENFTS